MSGFDRAHVNEFYSRVPYRDQVSILADYFSYFLQVELSRDSVTVAEIKKCFEFCDLQVPVWVAQHLSNNSKGKKSKYVKAKVGYRLHASEREKIASELGSKPEIIQVSTPLRKMYEELNEGARKEFLRESLDSYTHGNNRSAVVMFWLFLMDHLYELVLTKHLAAFNTVLATNTDRRVKVDVVSKRDDFGDIPEGKFVEFLRSAGIVSNDVRKILDQKLGTRNTAAHPSTVTFKASKAAEFLEDLIENVCRKYPL
jgi:hypothetical protein